jgi:O-acetyl-ADP-ribose deacetylase (regulator of RNase III)
MKIQFVDRNADIVAAVASYTRVFTYVKAIHGSILWIPTDAVVSPANSFGYMDGGIDLAYSVRFGWGVQKRLQAIISGLPDAELPVGQAVVLETNDPEGKIPYLVSAPTMREPQILGEDTINPFLATKAAIAAAVEHGGIKYLSIPGMGTGIGKVPPHIFAVQAAEAILELIHEGILPRQ